MDRPRIEDLLVPSLAPIFYESSKQLKWALDEDEVTKCLDPRRPMQMASRFDQIAYVIGLCQTSSLFVVSARETTNIIRSAGQSPLSELPRLPYARVAVEPLEDHGWVLQSQTFRGEKPLSGEVDPKDMLEIWAAFISERSPGRVWDCTWYWSALSQNSHVDVDLFIHYVLKVTDDGIEVCDFRDDERPLEAGYGSHGYGHAIIPVDNDQIHALLRTFTIELAHIIGARNVPHETIRPDRHEHRRMTRRAKKAGMIVSVEKPVAYYVNLSQSGEAHIPQEGMGKRQYHVRWLVRGHWRYVGHDYTWVRPHVKGPIGAPWKGRPVYIDKEKENVRSV